MTIDQGAHMQRYQGLVALDGAAGLAEAGHQYFRQSEQIPTRLRLATARVVGADGESWRAGGIMASASRTSTRAMIPMAATSRRATPMASPTTPGWRPAR